MAKKAFVRYAKNKIVAGSLILADKAPKMGVWKEVPYDLCCVPDCVLGGPTQLLNSYNGDPGPENSNIVKQVSFGAGPITGFYIDVSCGDYSTYWGISITTPPMSNITDLMNYVNATLSSFGTFTATPIPGFEAYYNIGFTTTTSFLNIISGGLCPTGLILYAGNF